MQVGVASETRRMRGYIRPQRGGSVRLTVELPAGSHRSITAWAGGRRVTRTVSGRNVVFTLATRARRPADWAVTWR